MDCQTEGINEITMDRERLRARVAELEHELSRSEESRRLETYKAERWKGVHWNRDAPRIEELEAKLAESDGRLSFLSKILGDVTAAIPGYSDSPDGLAAAVRGLVEKLAASETAAWAMRRELKFTWDEGPHSHEDGCPEDDTCTCPEIVRLNAALSSDTGVKVARVVDAARVWAKERSGNGRDRGGFVAESDELEAAVADLDGKEPTQCD